MIEIDKIGCDNIPKFQDLTGKKFGKWTVIKRVEDYVTPGGNKFTQYECVCSCGQKTIRSVCANALRSGASTSCGCVQRSVAAKTAADNFVTHGDSKLRMYKIWAYMLKRCESPTASNYANYGGRGVSVCGEWHNYECFKRWALCNGYTDRLSIDRIDVTGNYEPSNCRWIDSVAQANNRRSSLLISYNGKSHTLAEWARILDKPYKLLHKRIRTLGFSVDEAFAK